MKKIINGMMDPLDVKLMNCAVCGRAMLGPSMLTRDDLPPVFAAYLRYSTHVNDRPWCAECVEHRHRKEANPPCVSGKSWGRSFVVNGDGANVFEDVVRRWEDAK